MKHKKAQAILVGVMIAFIILIALIQLIDPLKEQITTVRNADNLDCANSSITTGQKSTCILVDMSMFYFVGVSLAAAIGFITLRRIRKGG